MITDVTDKMDTTPSEVTAGVGGPRSWQVVLAAGLAVFTAAAVTLILGLDDAATADTYVTSVTQAVIALPDGSQKPAKIGALLPRGAELRTGQNGGARLTTAGRDVYVGAMSTIRVLDGVRESLDKGLVMVDTRGGPRLTLRTKAGSVSTPPGVLARVEQNVATLRLAVYDGSSAITAVDRRATTSVPALHQVRVPYGGVASPTTALALTVQNGSYDQWEQRLASNLVQADIDLNSFASGLNGSDGIAVLTAAPAALRTSVLPGRTRGEQALAVAVAQKATLNKEVKDNLAEVQQDRGDGGSWGVVAAIVKAPVTDVTSVVGTTLDELTSRISGVLAVGPLPSFSGLFPFPTTTASNGSTSRPRTGPRPTRPVTAPPETIPSPTAVVDQVVTTVLQLLPTPSAAPVAPPPKLPTKPVVPIPRLSPPAPIGPLG